MYQVHPMSTLPNCTLTSHTHTNLLTLTDTHHITPSPRTLTQTSPPLLTTITSHHHLTSSHKPPPSSQTNITPSHKPPHPHNHHTLTQTSPTSQTTITPSHKPPHNHHITPSPHILTQTSPSSQTSITLHHNPPPSSLPIKSSYLFPPSPSPCLQSMMVTVNLTANEYANYYRYRHFKQPNGTFKNPFNHGIINNLLEFFYLKKPPYVQQQRDVYNV